MSRLIYIGGGIFSITLAVVIGIRLSADAIAVVIGIVCGVLASIPTTAVLVWVLRQRDKQLETQLGQPRPYGQHPPIVVVNGQNPGTLGSAYQPAPALMAASGSGGMRNFKVIGQENTETTGDVLPPFWDEL